MFPSQKALAYRCQKGHVSPCTRHSECIGQQMCYANNCVPAMPAGGMCITDSNCETKNGQACISGICMVPAVTTPAPATPPPVIPPFPIFPPIPGLQLQYCLDNNHNSCPGQQICVFFLCFPAQPAGKSCTNASECGAGQACKFGECWRAATIFGMAFELF
ncbi:hypothetical protein TTRE_0000413601 [Trichuris trichiura]|uniref:DUF7107 domain-containing protein n=1 Tax=Trichuris trichiura TaxID=36087 RepID=A0A077Z5X6_TRITR|nr:hypothetical protein TTRE_0000413601 [Trichuris trichiura]